MRKLQLSLLLAASIAGLPGVSTAKGCLKGAAVGGVVGHVAGRHAVAGAVVGCVVGHHRAKAKNEQVPAGTNGTAPAGARD